MPRGPDRTDLLVAGAGPAGLATAILAARSGMRVRLLERRALPADKPCGEGLMPGGVRLLERMGVDVERAYPFHGIRYIDERSTAEARFHGTEARGLGIRRTELSRALVSRAHALGVMIETGVRLSAFHEDQSGVAIETDAGMRRARFLVGADGLHSRVRRLAGLDAEPAPSGAVRLGTRRHYRVAPWCRYVEVYWAEGAEVYVTPVAADEVGVAVLSTRGGPTHDEVLERFPSLSRRLARESPTSELRGAGPLRRDVRGVARGRLALVGDAAGYRDAITGEGVALAFRSAEALVDSLSLTDGVSVYARRHRAIHRRYRVFTGLALQLAARPGLRRWALRALSAAPTLFTAIVRSSSGGGYPRGASTGELRSEGLA